MSYVGIFLSAILEGEVVYVGAAVLAHSGRLNPLAVVLAGAAGGSAGDQIAFYLVRSRFAAWLDRVAAIARIRENIRKRVERNATLMILSIRFMPGLRIAISGACAYGGVSPLRFSIFSMIGGLAWASSIMLVVMFAPNLLGGFGLHGWKAALVPAVLIILLFHWLSRSEKRAGQNEPPAQP